MSRFVTKEGARHKPTFRLSSKKRLGISLTALLAAFGMIAFYVTISAGSASAAGDNLVIQVPANPTPVDDPCNPAGVTNNASWGTIPADSDIETADYILDFKNNGDGSHVLVAIIDDSGKGYTFPDSTTTHDYGTAPDSGVACAPETTVIDVPPTPPVNNPPGPNNATWNLPANTDTIHWTNDNGHAIATIVADNTTFPGGSTSHDYGVAPDADQPETTVIPVPATPDVTNPPGPNNATWNVPSNDDTQHWAVDGDGHLIVTIVADNTTYPGGATTHDYGVAPDPDQSGGGNTTEHVKQSSLTEHANDCTGKGNDSGQLNVTDPTNVDQDSIVVTTTKGSYTSDDLTFSLQGNVLQITVPLAADEFISDATISANADWDGQFVLSHYTCGEVTPPPVDVCPNLDGNQSSVPDGWVKDDNGDCVVSGPPNTDVCPNIPGNQSEVPSGLFVNSDGNCVDNVVIINDPPVLIEHGHTGHVQTTTLPNTGALAGLGLKWKLGLALIICGLGLVMTTRRRRVRIGR
jgi:hypothetical protein